MCHISDHESRISLFLDTNASIQKKNWPTSHFFLRSNFSQIIQSCMEKSFSKVFYQTLKLILLCAKINTTRKMSVFGVFSGLYFPAFGMNKEIYKVNLRIQSECGKMHTRKTPNTDNFHAVQHWTKHGSRKLQLFHIRSRIRKIKQEDKSYQTIEN